MNSPILYNDPSGHKACGDGEEWSCDGGKKQDPDEDPNKREKNKEDDEKKNKCKKAPFCLPLGPALPPTVPVVPQYPMPIYDTSTYPARVIGYTYELTAVSINIDPSVQVNAVNSATSGVVTSVLIAAASEAYNQFTQTIGPIFVSNIQEYGQCGSVCGLVGGAIATGIGLLADITSVETQTSIEDIYFDQTPFELQGPAIDLETGQWIYGTP